MNEDYNMDKPVTLSMKAWLIRNMSVKMSIQERVITAVIDHQFVSALDAMKTVESMEFSGFGKFWFNRRKVNWKMEKMLRTKALLEKDVVNDELTPQKRHIAALKLITINKDIEYLKPKIHD